MFRLLITISACVFGGIASAATNNVLDHVLRLDSVGFTAVTIYDDDFEVEHQFERLSAEDDTWGISKPHERFSIGEEVSLTAKFDEYSGQAVPCYVGSISCNNAFGEMDGDSFQIGDGSGMTLWGDFLLEGGTNVGDSVSLGTFSGGLTYEALDGGGFASWGTYDQYFTVAKNDLAPSPVPIPASFALLAVGLGGIGFIGRRRKKAA